MSGYVGPQPSPLDLLPGPPGGSGNVLQDYVDQLSHLHGFTSTLPAPSSWPYANNPVGTETTQSMGAPSAANDEVAYVTSGGVPVMRSQMEAVHAQIAQAKELALTMALGMVGDAPGGGAAASDVLRVAGRDVPVRPATEDVHEVIDSNFTHGRNVGPRTVPIDSLTGGTSVAAPEAKRVADLQAQITGPDGYISRPIVDTDGNVLEGQHRLDALRAAGATEVPVHVVQDLAKDVDLPKLHDAMQGAQKMGLDHQTQMVRQVLDAVDEAGGPAAAKRMFYPPEGYERAWNAALDHLANGQQGSPGVQALRVYHGTPHQFSPVPDNPLGAFDLSKIGTGEGAQVYGHGIYVAEHPKTAQSYRESVVAEPTFDMTAHLGEGADAMPASDVMWATRDIMLDHPDLEHVEPYIVEQAAEHVVQGLSEGMRGDDLLKMNTRPPALRNADGTEAIQKGLDMLEGTKVNYAGPTVGGKPFNAGDPVHEAAVRVHEAGGDPDKAIAAIDERLTGMLPEEGEDTSSPNMQAFLRHVQPEVDKLMASKRIIDEQRGDLPAYKPPGHMYEADISRPAEDFLHWDKAFSQQSPQVQEGLRKLGIAPPEAAPVRWEELPNGTHRLLQNGQPAGFELRPSAREGYFDDYQGGRYTGAIPARGLDHWKQLHAESLSAGWRAPDPQGSAIYHSLSNERGRPAPGFSSGSFRGDPAAASEALRDAGIPGIRYLDQFSRKPGEKQTHNFVMFDPSFIKIVKRYGIGALIPGAGATGLLAGGDDQQ